MIISFTSMTDFLSCPRRFQLAHLERLEPARPSWNLMAGNIGHAAFEAACRLHFEHPTATDVERIDAALDGLNRFVGGLRSDAGKIRDDDERLEHLETVDEQAALMANVIIFQIPLFDWNRYRVVTAGEALLTSSGTPAIELTVERQIEGAVTLAGTIDVVMRDQLSNSLVIFDWKFRNRMPSPQDVELDQQLDVYVELLDNELVRQAVQYNMRRDLPSPVKFNKSGSPSRQNTMMTWEMFATEIERAGWRADDFADLREKMKTIDYWTNPLVKQVTQASRRTTWANVIEAGRAIWEAYTVERFPGVLSSFRCSFCPFKDLCIANRLGLPLEPLVKSSYQVKDERYADDEEEE